jgi:hypothetical protein
MVQIPPKSFAKICGAELIIYGDDAPLLHKTWTKEHKYILDGKEKFPHHRMHKRTDSRRVTTMVEDKEAATPEPEFLVISRATKPGANTGQSRILHILK